MKKSTIQLLVTVDIWTSEYATKEQAIRWAKSNVLSTSSTYSQPKKAVLYRKPKDAAQTADRAAGGECCEYSKPYTYHGTRIQNTSCGVGYEADDDFKFCPYCSRKIHVKES